MRQRKHVKQGRPEKKNRNSHLLPKISYKIAYFKILDKHFGPFLLNTAVFGCKGMTAYDTKCNLIRL